MKSIEVQVSPGLLEQEKDGEGKEAGASNDDSENLNTIGKRRQQKKTRRRRRSKKQVEAEKAAELQQQQ